MRAPSCSTGLTWTAITRGSAIAVHIGRTKAQLRAGSSGKVQPPVRAERGIGSNVEVIPIQKINEAYDRLAKVFYKFKEIDWVAFDKVQEAARARKKPILVVVAQGVLDNQTC